MLAFQRFLCLGTVLAFMAGGVARAAQSSASQPAVLASIVGTWNCTYHGPKGTMKSTIAFTCVNDLWDQGISKEPAYAGRPANDGIVLVGYDSKKHQYVSFSGKLHSQRLGHRHGCRLTRRDDAHLSPARIRQTPRMTRRCITSAIVP